MTPRTATTFIVATLLVVACARPSAKAGAHVSTQCFADSFRARVDHGLTGFADVINIPGISFAIVRDDSIIYSGGIGYADRT